MLSGFIGGFVVVYIAVWLAAVVSAYDDYTKAGTAAGEEEEDKLLLATFVGPLVFFVLAPPYIAQLARIIVRRCRGKLQEYQHRRSN